MGISTSSSQILWHSGRGVFRSGLEVRGSQYRGTQGHYHGGRQNTESLSYSEGERRSDQGAQCDENVL